VHRWGPLTDPSEVVLAIDRANAAEKPAGQPSGSEPAASAAQ
jgi:hypothetical protein